VNKEKKLNVEETKHTEMLDVGADMFKKAYVKLKEALKTKDMKQIAVAHAMLDTAEKVYEKLAHNFKKLEWSDESLRKGSSHSGIVFLRRNRSSQ